MFPDLPTRHNRANRVCDFFPLGCKHISNLGFTTYSLFIEVSEFDRECFSVMEVDWTQRIIIQCNVYRFHQWVRNRWRRVETVMQWRKDMLRWFCLARISWMTRSRMIVEERLDDQWRGADDGDPGNQRWSGTGGM